MTKILSVVGRLLAQYLNKERPGYAGVDSSHAEQFLASLRPGDVLLVEGSTRFSTAIKYLTQSTWSHSALFIGTGHGASIPSGHCFVEADILAGVRTVGFDEYRNFNMRICRPVGLSTQDCQRVVGYAMARLGNQYDLRNVVDLVRYLIATPPVPQTYRRRMIALGSGDPTRAICSTLIAQAFQSIRYPILPIVEQQSIDSPDCRGCTREILHIRHHSLFAPRDFDLSPYFQVIKPALAEDFDFKSLNWDDSNLSNDGTKS